jgi:hypothetical protein
MRAGILSSDFIGPWSLSFADIDFINSKPAAARLGLASQLKFFSARGFFADDGALIPNDAAEYLAEQIGVRADELDTAEAPRVPLVRPHHPHRFRLPPPSPLFRTSSRSSSAVLLREINKRETRP